jgi:hypothetical protein
MVFFRKKKKILLLKMSRNPIGNDKNDVKKHIFDKKNLNKTKRSRNPTGSIKT